MLISHKWFPFADRVRGRGSRRIMAGALVFPEPIAAFARLELPRLRLVSF
jgi:hypothetical protein